MTTKERAPFWDHVQSSADVAVAQLGVQGKVLLTSDQRFLNVALYSHKAGKFWYGDLYIPADKSKIEEIAKELGVTVYVIPELMTDDVRPIADRALLEVTA